MVDCLSCNVCDDWMGFMLGCYKVRQLEYVTYETLQDVELERIRQNVKWGKQRHSLGVWLAILGEEFGEVCQATQGYLKLVSKKESDKDNLYEELIQLAAVAVAIAEQMKEETE